MDADAASAYGIDISALGQIALLLPAASRSLVETHGPRFRVIARAGHIGANIAGYGARPLPSRHAGRSMSPTKAGEPGIHAFGCINTARRGWWACAHHDGEATGAAKLAPMRITEP